MLYQIIVSGHVETYKDGYKFSACCGDQHQIGTLLIKFCYRDVGDKCWIQLFWDKFGGLMIDFGF